MILRLWLGDEGPTDRDLRDGDIHAVFPDTHVPGALELKKYLHIKVEEYQNGHAELVKSDYQIGTDGPEERHMRRYFVRYWNVLTPTELEAVADPEVSVPIVEGRFSLFSIVRKQ